MKWFSIFFVFLTMTGCLTGRSWDTPGSDITQNSLPDVTHLILYIDGDVNLMRRALTEVPIGAVEFKAVERKDDQQIIFPVIKVTIQPPGWRDNWFTISSGLLSGFTISIIPGYFYQASEVNFQLTLLNSAGKPVTTEFSYAAKRHYVSWLPLLVVGNFTQTVQVWTEPKLDWDVGYRRIVLQFFHDAKPALDEYRMWLASQGKSTSQSAE